MPGHYIISGFWLKYSCLSTKGWLLKWVDSKKKQIYLIWWIKERLLAFKKTLKKNCPQKLYTTNMSSYDVENINIAD